MYVLTVALSKHTFILTLNLIISRENVDSKHAKIITFHMPCKLVQVSVNAKPLP